MVPNTTRMAVAAVQAMLRVSSGGRLAVDGIWGKNTNAAVESAPKEVFDKLDSAARAVAGVSVRDLAPAPPVRKASSFDKLVDSIVPLARAANLIPEAVVAQLALESGWGKSALSAEHFNFGGLKYSSVGYYPGKKPGRVVLGTREFERGSMLDVEDGFATFEDEKHFAEVYVWYLTRSNSAYRYRNLERASSPREYFQILKNGGYATDPDYVGKLLPIVSSVERRYAANLAV